MGMKRSETAKRNAYDSEANACMSRTLKCASLVGRGQGATGVAGVPVRCV
jgi:hypothetical protein